MFRVPFVPGVCVAAAVLAATISAAGDWPQFRGPHRDGVSAEKGLLAAWPAEGPGVLWRTELGAGYSALAVAGGRIYTMFSRDKDEFVGRFDAATGEQSWRVRVGDAWDDRFGGGPRSTPTVDGKALYALGSHGTLYALATADGATLWKHDLEAEYSAKAPQWGFATSVLVEDGLVLVDVGGRQGSGIVAFDKATGKETWRSQDQKAGYSAPIALEVGGVRQVVFFTGKALLALNPKDGSLLWQVPWKTSWDVNAATPIFIPPDKVFVSSGYDVGAAVYRITASEGRARVDEVWKNREMKNKFSSSVFHGGNIYGFDEKTLKCIGAADGETKWQARGLGHGSLIFADGHLVVLGDEGTLLLVEATPDEYREKGRMQLFDGRTWTVPTLSGGTLFVRDEKQLVALAVARPES